MKKADITQKLKTYLKHVLDVQLDICPWDKEKKLPFFLRETYDFYQGSLIGETCLFLIPKEEETAALTPSTVKNHVEQLAKEWQGSCIFISPNVSSYNRKRFIQKHVPFIIPGNQMYLPNLGLDLREHFQQPKKHVLTISPATQATIIYILLEKEKHSFSPSQLAKELKYTRMTMTRVFNEIESIGLGKIERIGKKRALLIPINKKSLWEKAKRMLQSPVKKTIFLKKNKATKKLDKNWVVSGLTALSVLTMVNPPKLPIKAISQEDWRSLHKSYIYEEVPYPDEANIELEIWSYDPKLFNKQGLIDPYSLYLSLQEYRDERVEAVLEKLMEELS